MHSYIIVWHIRVICVCVCVICMHVCIPLLHIYIYRYHRGSYPGLHSHVYSRKASSQSTLAYGLDSHSLIFKFNMFINIDLCEQTLFALCLLVYLYAIHYVFCICIYIYLYICQCGCQVIIFH